MLEHDGRKRLGQVLSLRLEQVDAGRGRLGADGRGAGGAQPAGDRGGERRGRDPVRRRRAVPRRHDPRRDAGEVAAWLGEGAGAARSCRSASCGSRPACRSRSTPAASTATRSSAASRARARPTRSASCSSSCCWRRAADRDPRPELGLRPPARGARRRRRGDRGALAGVAGGIDVRRRATGASRLRLRLPRARAARPRPALLRLDPVADREEHAELDAVLDEERPQQLEDLLSVARPTGAALALRIAQPRRRPLGRLGARRRRARRSTRSATRPLPRRRPRLARQPRGAGARRRAPCSATLWERRAERRPVLIVIDEAHNVCPARPAGRTDRARDRARRADRRRGAQVRPLPARLTQRPQKVQENVISQCDNLVLMRMDSAADLAYVGERALVRAARPARPARRRSGSARRWWRASSPRTRR